MTEKIMLKWIIEKQVRKVCEHKIWLMDFVMILKNLWVPFLNHFVNQKNNLLFL